MKINLCPSMMCARYGNLHAEIDLLQKAGADIFHLDVMDGHFVHNIGMGLQDITYICSHSSIKTEVHLMMEMPSEYVQLFVEAGVDIIYIHPESEYHAITTLQRIQEMGLDGGIVLNPGTAVATITELLPVVRRIMVMGVNPGQAGQMYLPYAEKKIDKLLDLKRDYNFSIGMDGACNIDRIVRLSRKGVENFVLGTAALFNGNMDYMARFQEIKQALKEA